MITDNTRRNIQGMAGQLTNAIAQQIEAEQAPQNMLRQNLLERQQLRRIVAKDVLMTLRARPENCGAGIPDDEDEAVKLSKKLTATAVMDAENIIAELALSEKADEERFIKQVEELKREQQDNQPRIVRPGGNGQ